MTFNQKMRLIGEKPEIFRKLQDYKKELYLKDLSGRNTFSK